jgi:hypothetical protein
MNLTAQLPTSLDHLSRPQKLELKAALEEKERRRCARDAEYWLFRYAKTRDEHDPSIAAKPFPNTEYLRELVRFWLAGKMNIIEKSRQMMCSWVLCSLYLWDSQFSVNRLSFLSSKKGRRQRPLDSTLLHGVVEPANVPEVRVSCRVQLLPPQVSPPK